MPRVCTICTHEDREAIDRELAEATAKISDTAALFGVSYDALRRHRDAHLPATLAQAVDAAEVARADDLLAQIQRLHSEALGILADADSQTTALRAVREARECLRLLGQILGELNDGVQVNVLVNPVWLQTKTVIMAALAPHPEARRAVVRALEGLTDG
jgi:transposase-like protein